MKKAPGYTVQFRKKKIKDKPLSQANIRFLKELRETVNEVNLYKTGKLKGRPFEELLNEL